MRIRYIAVALVLIVVIALVAVGILASNVDRFRPKVQAELQEKLGRQVTIGHLGLHLFPLSIRADSLNVSEAPGFSSTRPFAVAKALYVSVGLFSLIGGNPEVKDIILDQPQIELIQNPAGVWNYSTIGNSGGANTASSGSSSSNSVSLNKLQINDGQVAITDQKTNQPRSVYDHIDLKLTDFAPGKKFGVDAGAHFPGEGKQLLSFKGNAGPLNPANSAATPIDGHVSIQEFSVAGLNRLVPRTVPPQTDSTASGEADVTSQGAELSAKGNLKLQNTTLKGSKLDFPINANYDLSSNRAQDTIQVKSGTLELGSTTFTLSGNVDAHAKPANLDVRLSTKSSSLTELAKLAGAFGVALNPAYQVKGFLTADVAAKGPATSPQLNGTVSGKQIEASGGEIKQPVSVPEIDIALAPDTIRSNTFTATSGATKVTGNFALAQYSTPNMNVDATLQTEGANIAELLNIAKAYGISAAEGMSGSGNLSANIHVKGPVSKSSELAYSGNANISKASLTSPSLNKPLSITSANVQFSQNSVAITGLNAAVGATGVQGNLSAKNFAAPEVQFNLSSDKIDTADLESLTSPSKPAPKSSAAAKAPAAPPASNQPPLIDTITGSGTLHAGTIKAQEIVLTSFQANVKLNHGVVTLSPLTTDIFGGKENGTLTVDVRPATPLCAVNAKFAGVDTNALLSAVSSAKNTLYGSLAAQTNLQFALASSNDLPRTLNGTLNFDVTNGQLKNVNILGELSKVGKFLGAAPGQGGNSTALKKFAGTLNIVNGVASTNNLTAALDAGSLAANGTMNLVNQGLNLHMTAALASGTSKAVGGSQVGGFMNTALANNKGELVIPVLVTGTMDHPTFTPDAQALAKMKLNNLLPSVSDPSKLASGILGGKGGAGGIVNGLLGGQAAPAQQGKAQPQQNNTQDSINSLLNQFGKKKKKQ